MIPAFAYPPGLIGLAALPLLAGIYLLRRRHRRLPVSALFLWERAQPPRQGGTRLDPTRLPWLFLLELLILLLLALAAADPWIARRDVGRTLLVVLDATATLNAPGPDGTPAREQALRRLRREFRAEPWERIRVIEARATPVMRVDAADVAEATAQLAGYRANAPAGGLAPALALAARLAGPADALLVLTDRPPAGAPEDPRLRWVALGAALPNLAFVDALRAPDARGHDACRVELANFSTEPQTAELFLEQDGRVESAARLTLAPGARHALRLNLPFDSSPLLLRLEPPDAFPDDNRVVLCATPTPRVGIAVETTPDTPHTALLLRALAASDLTGPAGTPTALTVREADTSNAPGGASTRPWTLLWHQPPEARPLAAPFLRGPRHPVTDELAFEGLLWGARPGYRLPGLPLLSAADGTPLLSLADGPVLHLHWVPAQSTLQRAPAWPILVDNLLRWRADSLPEGQPRNLRLGDRLSWPVPPDRAATVRAPDGRQLRLPAHDGTTVFEPDTAGTYRITVGEDAQPVDFAVNLLSPETSDLRGRGAGEWGERLAPEARLLSRTPVAWALLLAAAGLCAAHVALVTREPRP